MLGKAVILASFSGALYTGNPQAWNAFYISLAIGVLLFLAKFIAHRRKWSKLVRNLQIYRSQPSLAHHIRSFGVI